MEKKKPSTARQVIGLLVLGALLYGIFGGAIDDLGAKNYQNITDQVATNSVAQYQIAARHGNGTDMCVHAGMVAAAYLQAKNESEYAYWKMVEKKNCAAIGVHQQ